MHASRPDGLRIGSPWQRTLRASSASAAVGALCFVASIPLGPDFAMRPTLMGVEYAAMSHDPLGGHGPHPERFLSPLLAKLLGLAGDRYALFSHGMLVLFLALVHRLAFVRTRDHAFAILLTAAIAASGTVEVYRGLVGYTEPTSFCLLALALLLRHRHGVFWLLMALNLLNHGQTLFLWPWLLWERSRVARLGAVDAVLGAAALGAYAAARVLLIPASQTAVLDAEWYLRAFDPVQALELWVFVVPAAVLFFGPLLVVLGWDLLGDRRRESVPSFLLLLAGVCGVLVLAMDVFRFVGLLAFAMLAAAHRRLAPDRRTNVVLAAALALTLALLPLQRTIGLFLLRRLAELQVQGVPRPTLHGLLPAYWYAFAGYAAFAVLVGVAAKLTLPRGNRQPSPAAVPEPAAGPAAGTAR